MIDEKLEERIEKAKELIESGLSARNELKIKVRQPLSQAVVQTEDPVTSDAVEEFGELIAGQLNVKKVTAGKLGKELHQNKGRGFVLGLDTKMTDELKREGFTRELTRAVQHLRKKLGLVETDEITVQIVAPEDVHAYAYKDEIKESTNTAELDLTTEQTIKDAKEKKLNWEGKQVTVLVKKL